MADGHKIVLCVCTCNRPKLLAELLGSLKSIDLTDLPTVEIIVVDNAPHGAKSVCDRALGLPVRLHYRPEQHRGRAFARNTAVTTALQLGADFIAFIDDDDIPEPDWLRQVVVKQRETDADIVFGIWKQGNLYRAPRWAKTSVGAFRRPAFGEFDEYGIPRNTGGGNVLIARHVFEEIPPPAFDPAFPAREDRDFFIRAAQLGARMGLAEKAIISRGHGGRQTTRQVLKHGFETGCGNAAMDLKYGSQAEIRAKQRKVVSDLLLRCLGMIFWIIRPDRFMRNLYRIVRGVGSVYTYWTASIKGEKSTVKTP